MASLALDMCETQTYAYSKKCTENLRRNVFWFQIQASYESIHKVKVTSVMRAIAGADARHSPPAGRGGFSNQIRLAHRNLTVAYLD